MALIRTTAVLAALILPGCGLFAGPSAAETAAVVETVGLLERVNAARLDRELSLTERITDPEAAAAWAAAARLDAEATTRLHASVLAWLAAWGEIDWSRVVEQLRPLVEDVTDGR